MSGSTFGCPIFPVRKPEGFIHFVISVICFYAGLTEGKFRKGR